MNKPTELSVAPNFALFQHWFFQKLKPDQRKEFLRCFGFDGIYALEQQFAILRAFTRALTTDTTGD
jgi:hypothetical protein